MIQEAIAMEVGIAGMILVSSQLETGTVGMTLGAIRQDLPQAGMIQALIAILGMTGMIMAILLG